MNPTFKTKAINVAIKVAVVVLFVTVLAYELIVERDIAAMWQSFLAVLSWDKAWVIGLVVLLIPINWAFEVMKWSQLMRPVHRISWNNAAKAVMGGLALSLFTPNRIGEYGGRVLFVPSRYNWYAVIATLTGSFAQNLVLIFGGLVAGAWYLQYARPWSAPVIHGIQLLIGCVLLIAVILYFRLPKIALWASGLRVHQWLKKPFKALTLLQKVTTSDLNYALLFSALKYAVFCSQFVLLLYFFDVKVPMYLLFVGVALMYLFQTSIPLPPFIEVMLRTEIGILVWTSFEINELSVLAASFFIWILNLVIPAFFGLVAISTVNVVKSLGYDQESIGQNSDSSPGDYGSQPVSGTAK